MQCFYTQTELNEALVIDSAKALLSHSDRYSASLQDRADSEESPYRESQIKSQI